MVQINVCFFSPLLVTLVNAAASPLPQYHVDKGQVTVSGCSAGAFMSIQMHVAYSAQIKGAGSIAGAIYNCANGNETVGYDSCCYANPPIDVPPIMRRTDKWASTGEIDPTSHLVNSPVYIFWGTNDQLVYKPPSDWAVQFYEHYKSNVTFKYTVPAAHAFVTDFFGNNCATQGPPGIVNCNFNLAGEILKKMYGNLTPRTKPGTPLNGQFIEFNQRVFYHKGISQGLDDSGWLFVPKSCSDKTNICKLHVVFHGCRQGQTNPLFGMNIVKNTGYNEWADTNNIIVMYPQAGNDANDWCLDWAGIYPGSSQTYSTKSGIQMRSIMNMIEHVSSAAGLSPRHFIGYFTSLSFSLISMSCIGSLATL